MRKVVLTLTVLLVAACGGGGGGGGGGGETVTAVSVSGVAIDGNLHRATVFLDLNGDGLFTTGEPTTTTNETGNFTLTSTQDQLNKFKVVVLAVAGITIDQDNPNTPISSSFSLVAPAGNPSVVSPLTTQVVAKMDLGATLESAKFSVQSELGLTNIDLMKNYVALKATDSNYAKAHNVAVSITEILKTIEADSSSNTKFSDKLASLSLKITTQVVPNLEAIKTATSLSNAIQVANIPKSTQTVLTGQLVDAPTAGVSYTCGNQSGKTDAEGKFKYQEKQSCKFLVGKVTIGTVPEVPTDKIVTPYDLVNVSRLSKIDSNAIGIAQFLQSLDDKSEQDTIKITSAVEQNLAAIPEVDLATERDSVKLPAITQLVLSGGGNSVVDRATASSRMESYISNAKINRKVRVENKKAPKPKSSSRFQFVYKYGWQNTDQYALKTWCNMDGNPPNCTPTYFVDGCRSYNGSCTKTNGYEQIADSSDGKKFRAYPIKPSKSFTAKYLGFGIGGGLPDFVKIYDSQNGSWSSSYTPSLGAIPNTLLATGKDFDVFFDESASDADGNVFTRHPGANDNAPGFQVYLGSQGVSISADNIYWIVVKYSDEGVRNERCVDFIGPNSFAIPNTFDGDSLLQWGTTLGNGYAFELMSADGLNWEPSNMIQGGVCNTFLAD